MRTKKTLVLAAAALGAAGAVALGGAALADEPDPRLELWIVSEEQTRGGTTADKDCPHRDGDRSTPREPGGSGASADEPGAGQL